MTKFDEAFEAAAKVAGFDWTFAYSDSERNIALDKLPSTYPIMVRAFNETLTPLFDDLDSVERVLNIYAFHVGFSELSSEILNQYLEEIMSAFIVFREQMKRKGIEVVINGKPFPQWEQTTFDEYGYVFNLTCKYKLCQY